MLLTDCCTAKVEQMAPPESSSIVPERNPASGRSCVLIVEDNPLNMKLFGAMNPLICAISSVMAAMYSSVSPQKDPTSCRSSNNNDANVQYQFGCLEM